MEKRGAKNVVVIGGGTGTSMLLRGLREYPFHLSAIVTTADTGGSSGDLRREIGILPPGDIRQCFVALNEDQHPIVPYFNYRFKKGGSLEGHSFGNLFLALLWQYTGDFQKALHEAESLFNSKHSVIPVTTGPTNLIAHLRNGKKIEGEHEIINSKVISRQLDRLELRPRGVRMNPEAKKALREADFIIIGPGNFFASLTPPLLVSGMVSDVKNSRAKKIYVANIMNQKGLTDAFKMSDYLSHFEKLFGKDIFDIIIYNTSKVNKNLLNRLKIKDDPIAISNKELDKRFVGANLLDKKISKQDPSDPIKRTYIRHDSKRVAAAIFNLIK